MDLIAVLNRLCTPAFLYAVVHLVILAYVVLNTLSRGTFFRGDVLGGIILNLIVVAVWVYILNFMCSKGIGPISWLLVLAPFIGMLVTSRKGRAYINLYDPNPLNAFF